MCNDNRHEKLVKDWNARLEQAVAQLADELDERLANAENEIRQVRDLLAQLK